MIFLSALPFVFFLTLPVVNAAPSGQIASSIPIYKTTTSARDFSETVNSDIARRQITGGTGSPRIVRLTACFDSSDTYYLEFARYDSISRLSSAPDLALRPKRDGKRPLWEGKTVEVSDGGSLMRANIEVSKVGKVNTYAGTAYDTFIFLICYSDAQHVVYKHANGDACKSIYYCKEGGPFA
jgi:hypothetical protein